MSISSLNHKIRNGMEVVCSKGTHVGTVDSVLGDQIKLTSTDSQDGKHHLVPSAMVVSVDTKVHLIKPCDQVKQGWMEE
jgi:hypothetical protein